MPLVSIRHGRLPAVVVAASLFLTACSTSVDGATTTSAAPPSSAVTTSRPPTSVSPATTTLPSTTQSQSTTTEQPPGLTLPPDSKITLRSGRESASSLAAEVTCREDASRAAVAALAWTPAAVQGTEQRIAVSVFAGSFLDIPFEVSPPLDPSISSYEWDRISGQADHMWTVLNLVDGIWIAPPPESFTGPTCVSDEQP